jgi:hypothetical protein
MAIPVLLSATQHARGQWMPYMEAVEALMRLMDDDALCTAAND